MKFIEDFKFKSECYFGNQDFKSILRVMINDGSTATIMYRMAQALRKINLGFIGFIVLWFNKLINGIVIGRNAEFDEGLVLMHPTGVIINGAVKGGKYIVIESGVVIGAARHGLPVEVPQLGNNILIGSGAKLLGGIKIGNNVKIGANAVVVKDVPDGATVVGIPGRIVRIDEVHKQKKRVKRISK